MELHTGLIEINWTSLMILINIFILYIILKVFFWEKIKTFMDNRSSAIKDAIDSADAMNKRADEKMANYNRRIAKIEEEGREIIKTAKLKADLQALQIIENARKQADDLIANAERRIELEHDKAIEDLRQEIATISMMVAEQIVEKEVDKEGQEAIVDSIIKKTGSAKWQS
ncbi:MAG: F0F1 ATP synthase subunit B [Bacillota bacterium]|nr:F0F1 ATP synthase subunit B [Bacillota bacterium]